ncbi:DUF3631 domain-containing protein [Mesorhizobium sp. M0244]|uniref:DUF3631 domain-containing protein n=1 Tax=Mesorhizobium sp. M0244 TaxID=2956926 RepID=UPI0033353EFA
MSRDVLAAALDYAAAGFPLLPISWNPKTGKKTPCIKDWPKLASTDPDQIRHWFGEQFPHAGIAALTGERSGLVLIDVDSAEGHGVDGFKSLRDLKKKHGLNFDHVPCVVTQSNGHNYLFRLPPGRTVKSGTSVLGAGIDVKGSNGCCVLPPTRFDPKRPSYDWLNGYRLPDAPRLPPEIMARLNRDKYQSLLDAACEQIVNAPAGKRNDTLSLAAYNLIPHAFAARLKDEELRTRLTEAALEAGLDRLETENTIDSAWRKRRQERERGKDGSKPASGGEAPLYAETEPAAEAVDGAALLDEMTRAILTYVDLTEHEATAVAFWVMHTHLTDVAEHSPRLHLTSPVKRCGKTVLLNVIKLLVPKPQTMENTSVAALFRLIALAQPTILIDEADSFLSGRDHADRDDLRGILNAGHRPGGCVLRTTGDEHTVAKFPVYGAVAIAGIGHLPPTLTDRSIAVRLQRKRKGTAKARLRERHAGDLRTCAARAARWAADNREALIDADPELPAALDDRTADNWRPLIAIAENVSTGWKQKAERAALALSNIEPDEEDTAVTLLGDIREIVGMHDRIKTSVLLAALHERPDRDWGEWRHGKPMSEHALGRLLRRFGIHAQRLDFGGPGNDRDQARGFKREHFEEAFGRYL